MIKKEQSKPKPVKRDKKCGRCGSNEFYVSSNQDRSNDEGATEYDECYNCGARSKKNS